MSRNALLSNRRLRVERLESRQMLAATVFHTPAPVTFNEYAGVSGVPLSTLEYKIIITVNAGSTMTLNPAANGYRKGTFDVKGEVTVLERVDGVVVTLVSNQAFEETGNVAEKTTGATPFAFSATATDAVLGQIALTGTTNNHGNTQQMVTLKDVMPTSYAGFNLVTPVNPVTLTFKA
jgi:hypothetical protein